MLNFFLGMMVVTLIQMLILFRLSIYRCSSAADVSEVAPAQPLSVYREKCTFTVLEDARFRAPIGEEQQAGGERNDDK
jgi:hypothetical protein